MVSRNKFKMCRLCLCENECFVNIFEMNDWQGYVAAEVISDLLQFKVFETDAYPHVVCLTCLTKLTDFRQFKECCRKSKFTYDEMFVSRESIVEHNPEMVEFTTVKAEPIYYSDNEDNDSQVQHRHVELVSHPQYLQSLEQAAPICTSIGAVGADSCTWNISTNAESIFEESENITLSEDVEASSSRTMERLNRQNILPGERINITPLFQQDVCIRKEVKKEGLEEDIGVDEEGWRGNGPEKGLKHSRGGFQCCHCGVVLKSKLGLVRHMKVHGFVSYDCGVCGKLFRYNCDFKRHVLRHSGTKLFKCTECNESFLQSSSLKTHMRSHTHTKPYKCSVCGKCFNHNGNLKRHMGTHTASKPYKCAVCSKCFSQNGNLKIHMRSHTGSKPYKCADCNKGYTQNSDLKRHMITHTFPKPYKCAECGKGFNQSNSLNKHMKSHSF